MALGATVLQPEGETGGVAQLGNRRRRQRKDAGIANLGKLLGSTHGHCSGCVLLSLALGPVFQRHEGQRGVLAPASKAEAQNRHEVLHLWLLEHVRLDLLDGFQRALLRGARRQLRADDDVALVFNGQEGRGQPHVANGHGGNDGQIDHRHATAALEQARHPAFVALGGAREAAVEGAKKALLFMVMPGLDGLEQRGAQRRRQRQCQKR